MRTFLSFIFSLWIGLLYGQGVELTRAKDRQPSNESRTTLAAVDGLLYGKDYVGESYVIDSRKFSSYAQLRALAKATPNANYEVWLSDRFERWVPDFIDKTTPDNNSTTIVGTAGVRYKLRFSSLVSPQAPTFKGTWNASTNQPTLSTVPAPNGTYYFVGTPGTQTITGVSENFEIGDRVISNGSGWYRIRDALPDGSVSEGKITTGAVSPAKTTFIVKKLGKNLYDKATSKDNYYVNDAGHETGPDSRFTLSQFIEVKPGQTYYGKASTGGSGMRFYSYYNQAGVWVSGGPNNFSTSFTVPSNLGIAYVRISILIGEKDAFQLELGSSQTAYEPYTISETLSGVKVDSTSLITASITSTKLAPASVTASKIAPKSITSTQIAAKSITPTEVSFVKTSVNLFNKADTTNRYGYYVGSVANGVPQVNSTYNVTHFIEVLPNTVYTPSYKHQIAYYTPSKVFIRGDSATRVSTTITTPTNAAFIRLTVAKTVWDQFQFQGGPTATTYEPFGSTLSGVGISIPDSSVTTASIKSSSVTAAKLATSSVTASKIAPKSITASQIASKSITPSEVNFITPSKNGFDKTLSKLRVGYFLNENGVEVADSRYTISDYIPVTAGLPYFGKGTSPGGMRFVSYFSSASASDYVKGGPASLTTTFTPPAGINYVRLTIASGDTATFQLEQNTVQTSYSEYGNTLSGVKISVPQNSVSSTELKDNAVTSAKLQTGAVTAPKAGFLVTQPGKNLFNRKVKEVGYYINENGTKVQNATYTLSDYIQVKADLPYVGKGNSSTGMRFVSYFTTPTEAGFVKGGPFSATTTFTPPAGINYARISIVTSDTTSFQLEQNTVRTAYEDYKEVYVLRDASKEIQVENLTTTAKNQIIADVKASLGTVEKPLATDYAISSKIYWPVGRQIEIYPENSLKYYEKWKGQIDLSSTIAGSKQTGRSLKATPSAAGTYTVTTSALDANYDVAYTVTTQVQSVPLTNTNPVKILNVGDSYTLRSTFTNRLNATASTGVTYLGIRRTTAASPAPQNAEGRGGYSLSGYTTIWKNTTQFSPFMQPTGNAYKFYGVTGFWKIVHGAGGYDWDYYENVKGMFDASTGYLKTPNVDDVQYDNALSKYVRWDGSAWVDIAESSLNFTFNPAKYAQAWNQPIADITHLMFGTNDFANSTETTFATTYAAFKANYEMVISAFKSYNPNVKIILGVPVSSGRQGDDEVGATMRRKRAYWLLAKSMYADFGGREAQNIYLADYHSTVDRRYGYTRTPEKPFQNYAGTENEYYLADYIHIDAGGFAQEGEQYMALIQLLRP